MSRSLQNLTLAVATFAVLSTAVASAQACGGRGGYGGSRGGYSSHHSTYRAAPVHYAPAPVHYAPAPAPVYHSQPAPVVVQRPVFQRPIAPAPLQVAPAPVLTAPAQLRVAPAPVQAAPVQAALPPTGAEQSALAALAALGGNAPVAATRVAATPVASNGMPQFAPATAAASTGNAGTWTATLANGSTVQLQLASNGTFRWVANSQGKVSSFDGSFTLAGGQLTLIRSSDNQQLAGVWAPQTNGGANFKLAGAKDNGLNFIRG